MSHTRRHRRYVFNLCRIDPKFLKDTESFEVQLFENCVAMAADSDELTLQSDVRSLPHAASVVSSANGYRPDVCLFADEQFCNSVGARTDLAALAWRPVVRFRSADYRYDFDESTQKYAISQVRMGVDHNDSPSNQRFHRPPAALAEAAGGDPSWRATSSA